MYKNRILILLIIVAILFLGLILWQRTAPGQYTENLDDAEQTDRCAEFRQTFEEEDEGIWSISYGGRVRQLLSGCF